MKGRTGDISAVGVDRGIFSATPAYMYYFCDARGCHVPHVFRLRKVALRSAKHRSATHPPPRPPAPSSRLSPVIRPHPRSEKFRPGAENGGARRRAASRQPAATAERRGGRRDPRPGGRTRRGAGVSPATAAAPGTPRRAGPGPLPAGVRSPQRRHETGSWVNGLCK